MGGTVAITALAARGGCQGHRGGGGWGAGWYRRVVGLGYILPFVFILAAVSALEADGNKCSSIGKRGGWKNKMNMMGGPYVQIADREEDENVAVMAVLIL